MSDGIEIPETPTEKQVFDACMHFRHDYGLMEPEEAERLRYHSKLWLEAWRKSLSYD